MADPIEKQAECLVTVVTNEGVKRDTKLFFCDVAKVGEFSQSFFRMVKRCGYVRVVIDVTLPLEE